MELSKVVASLALILGVLLATGYARADGGSGVRQTGQERLAAREAMQRAALAEHHRRKVDVMRLCNKPLNTAAELEACRAAYRKL